MDSDFKQAMLLLSGKAVLKRMSGVSILHDLVKKQDQLSILLLEYILEHDPNSAVKNRASIILKRSQLTPREGHWETHAAF